MKAKLPLKKAISKQARASLQRVMEKWKEGKDVFVLACIAQAVDDRIEAYQDTAQALKKQHGYELPSGHSVVGQEIAHHLLMEYGRPAEDGAFNLEGVDPGALENFKEDKKKAEGGIRAFNEAMEGVENEEVEIEFPRRIKVSEKDVKNDRITPNDCYLLRPFLDLTDVGEKEDGARKDSEEEGD